MRLYKGSLAPCKGKAASLLEIVSGLGRCVQRVFISPGLRNKALRNYSGDNLPLPSEGSGVQVSGGGCCLDHRRGGGFI